MSYVEDLAEAHKARMDRLWPVTKRRDSVEKVPQSVGTPPSESSMIVQRLQTQLEDKEVALMRLRARLAEVEGMLSHCRYQDVSLPASIISPTESHPAEVDDEERAPVFPRLDLICRTVVNHYGVGLSDITSQRKLARYVWPRQIAMYLCVRMSGRSMPRIGRYIGGRDHTTVMHGHRKIEALRQIDKDLDAELTELERRLGA